MAVSSNRHGTCKHFYGYTLIHFSIYQFIAAIECTAAFSFVNDLHKIECLETLGNSRFEMLGHFTSVILVNTKLCKVQDISRNIFAFFQIALA